MVFVRQWQFVAARTMPWEGVLWRHCARYGTASGGEMDPEVRVAIGRNTERLLLETERFLERGYSTRLQSLLHPQVTLLIQNSPEDVLLRVHGEHMYRRAYQVLRWTTALWYGLQYDRLRVHVFTASPPSEDSISPFRLRLRWRVEGQKRKFPWIRPLASRDNTPPTPVISGYSYYQFDQGTGMVRQHIVDRLVPPAARSSILWKYLERLQVNPLPAKPLVGSSRAGQG